MPIPTPRRASAQTTGESRARMTMRGGWSMRAKICSNVVPVVVVIDRAMKSRIGQIAHADQPRALASGSSRRMTQRNGTRSCVSSRISGVSRIGATKPRNRLAPGDEARHRLGRGGRGSPGPGGCPRFSGRRPHRAAGVHRQGGHGGRCASRSRPTAPDLPWPAISDFRQPDKGPLDLPGKRMGGLGGADAVAYPVEQMQPCPRFRDRGYVGSPRAG